jgi:ATP-dependent Clp protease ATP-binding subunit ClpA
MSEYMEKFAISRLVERLRIRRYEEGGQLTEKENHCIVLLDEIEKHTDVLICYYKS